MLSSNLPLKRIPTPNTRRNANPVGEYFFDQLLDHTNPSLGTFKQRYFFSSQYFRDQGSPIILSTPGEQAIDGFQGDLDGPALQNAMMQVFGAAGVVLERELSKVYRMSDYLHVLQIDTGDSRRLLLL